MKLISVIVFAVACASFFNLFNVQVAMGATAFGAACFLMGLVTK